MTYTLITGQTLSFSGDPKLSSDNTHYHAQGAVLIANTGKNAGTVVWCGERAQLPERYQAAGTPDRILDFGDRLIMPGFIDPHVHFPQYRMLASPGKDLVDWLTRFTFAEEARYAGQQHCQTAAELFLNTLTRHGTTACMAFSSVHKIAAETLFTAAAKRNMALITGKTMMDRQAPAAVLDTAEQGGLDSEELIGKWHNTKRLRYAITPRFAVTSTREQLAVSGQLLRDHPTCLMQTHLSESAGEMALIAGDFPEDADYTAVYERFGLLGPTSVFGHGIHLNARELACLAETGSAITHCPTSNTFLGSGLMDLQERRTANVRVGIASDIGGGTSYSMFATMAETYKIALLQGNKLSATELFYTATLGNAGILHIDGETGSIEPGKMADLIVIDPHATPELSARQALSENTEDMLFSLMFLADDRNITQTFIAGEPQRPAAGPAREPARATSKT